MKEYEKKPNQVNQEKIRWDNMIEKVMSIKNNSQSEIYFKGILSPLPLTTIFSLSGFQNSLNKPEWSPTTESLLFLFSKKKPSGPMRLWLTHIFSECLELRPVVQRHPSDSFALQDMSRRK